MDVDTAVLALAALSQSTRLETFRLLVGHEPGGLPAGEIARRVAVPQNTMSAHLAVLTRAGLAFGQRQGRTIVYRADLGRAQALIVFLFRDCCGGSAELCAPLLADLVPCCSQPASAS